MALESLLSSTVTSILVKGEPGAGKTTLALDLLSRYGKGVYVSTRVSKQKLLSQNPTFKRLIEKGNVFEVNPRLKNTKAKFEDLTLGTPTQLIESVIKAATKLAQPMIVLDSWDSIAKEIDKTERLKIEKTLLAIAEGNGAKLVFISEEPDLTTTDYLVDAIIDLKNDSLSHRRVRRIEWKKLRGAAIPQSSYLYTLHEGRFTMLERPTIMWPHQYRSKPIPPTNINGKYYPSGSEDLDSFFGGGIQKGSIILLELGEHIGPDWQVPMITAILSNFLVNGGCGLSIPAAGVTPNAITTLAKAYAGDEATKSSLKIGHYGDYGTDSSLFKLETNPTSDSFDNFWKQVANLKGGDRPCFIVVSIETAEYLYGLDNVVKGGIRLIQKVKYFNDVLMQVVKHGSKTTSELSNLADLHVKLEELDGSLVIYSVKPPSQLYHLDYDYNDGYPKVKLQPIV